MTNENILPLIPLRGITIFPNMVTHFDVGRDKSKAAVEAAMQNGEKIFLAPQKDAEIDNPKKSDISNVGTICDIKQIIKLPDDVIRVLVEGKERAKIKKYQAKKVYLEVELERIKEEEIKGVEIEAYIKSLKEIFIKFMKLTGENSKDVIKAIEIDNKIHEFIDMVSTVAVTREDYRQEILETIDLKKRIEKLLVMIEEEIEVIKIQKKITNKVKENTDNSQKEYYLREQLKVIQEELGEDDEAKREIKKYEEKISESKLPKEVKEKAEYELNRLKSMGPSSSEEAVIKTYLDWILDMPWSKSSKDTINIKKAEEVLDKQHYGLKDVKTRIIEYLAVKQMSNSMKGPILCLVGPPGVGKTSIAKSIAEAMNRKYSRIALGGMKDESEIRGHRKTYVGAIPGRIAYSLKETGTNNPLILFDEIDKISSNYKGDPADALLEVLDSEQNFNFRDNYLELPINLSNVFFIATANSLDTIPRALLDRLEVIEVSGYTYEEKFKIAKNHLIPNVLKEHDIEGKVNISDPAIKEIIEGYTRESGVRSLNRVISSIIRKAITEMVKKNKDSISINSKKVESLLGKKVFNYDKIDEEDKIGVVTGLAWTAYGGDTLPVEAMVMEGTGKLQLTGQLGDVMQESAKAAFTYVRANASKYGIDLDFYKNKDVHIHVPEGAVPKDGPSAGVTMTTALISALSKKVVKHNVAMTGEITLTGRVLPIGGLKEKSLAAVRAGVDTIIIPKGNEKDIETIPASIRKNLNVIVADKIDTVLSNAITQ